MAKCIDCVASWCSEAGKNKDVLCGVWEGKAVEKSCDNCKFIDCYPDTVSECKNKNYAYWESKNSTEPLETTTQTATGTTEAAKITTIESLKTVLDEKLELAKRKNSDYGDSVANILDKFKESGRNPHLSIYTRLADKFYRYENLLFNGNRKVSDESIDDTLMDLSNYIDLFMAWKKSREVE